MFAVLFEAGKCHAATLARTGSKKDTTALQPYAIWGVGGGLHTVKLQVRSWQRVIGMVSKDYGRLPTCKLPICKGVLLLKQSALPAVATHIVLDRPRKMRMQPFLLSRYPWESLVEHSASGLGGLLRIRNL